MSVHRQAERQARGLGQGVLSERRGSSPAGCSIRAGHIVPFIRDSMMLKGRSDGWGSSGSDERLVYTLLWPTASPSSRSSLLANTSAESSRCV